MVRDRLAREQHLGNAVEFGCGTGFYTDVLAGRSQKLIATDLAPGMLTIAQQTVKATNVTFQNEDCQRTSFPDSAFDTVFMSLVLHLTNPRTALGEMHRILKPGGILIVTNPDPRSLPVWDHFRWLLRGHFYGFTRYRTKPPKGMLKGLMSEQQLCNFLVESNFEISSTESIRNTSQPHNVPVEYIRAVKKPLDTSASSNSAFRPVRAHSI